MGFVASIFFFFAPYTDPHEQAVGGFFKGLTEHSSQTHTRARLNELLQRDIAVINLWTEYKYKGYKYLRKSERKKLYANLELLASDFDRFYDNNARVADEVVNQVRRLIPDTTVDPHKIVLIQALMDYFSPSRGVYEYRDSSSFGRLLRDPSHEKLIGDCNQIVTLYIYLYARYYDVRDLQVRVLPGHVALYYGGIDIETTNSTYARYDEVTDNVLLPVGEIVSINLLDTTDSYLSTHEVAAEDILQASRFAFLLSHNRDIVTQNLNAAYTRLVNGLIERNNYSKALVFATASSNKGLLDIVGHNGAVYEMKHHNYAAARRFAQHASDRDALVRNSWQAEGVRHYEAHRYHNAIRAFERIGEQTLVRQCYVALFFEEHEKLGSSLTAETIKNHLGTIKRMRTYAKKSGDKRLVEYTNDLNKIYTTARSQ